MCELVTGLAATLPVADVANQCLAHAPVLVMLATLGAMAWGLAVVRGGPWSETLLSAGIWWTVAAVLIAEGLGLLGQLGAVGLMAAWGALLAGVMVATGWLIKPRPAGAVPSPTWPGPIRSLGGWSPRRVWAWAGWLTAVLVVLVATVGVVCPPNSPDVHTYRLARVLHWLDQASLAHYPTSCLRQLYQGPVAELVVAEIMALSGGSDRLAFVPQMLAWLGSALAAAVVAAGLAPPGAGRWACQSLAVVIALTAPMAVLQASGAQNDLVAALWAMAIAWRGLCLVGDLSGGYFGPDADDPPRLAPPPAARQSPLWAWAELGAATGLAAATKPTTILMVGPFLLTVPVILAWQALRGTKPGAGGWPVAGRGLVLAAMVGSLCVAGHSRRCWRLFDSPIGPGIHADADFFNARIGPAAMVSNAVRNISLHTGTPVRSLNKAQFRLVRGLHHAIGLDPDDPATSWMGLPLGMPTLTTTEDTAGNPLHMGLILMAGPVALFGVFRGRADRRTARRLALLAGSVTAGFLIYGAVVRYQYWGSRLQTPIFALWAAPVAVVVVGGVGPRRAGALAATLAAAALYWVVAAQGKPLVGSHAVWSQPRAYLYLPGYPHLADDDLANVAALTGRQITRVGLCSQGNSHEYYVWVHLRAAGAPTASLRHVLVDNVSARLAPQPPPALEAVIVHQRPDVPPNAETITVEGRTYGLALTTGSTRLYLRADIFTTGRAVPTVVPAPQPPVTTGP